MIVGTLTLHLTIETADSLKDKRQVIRSLVQHLRNKFNVSVAEVDDLNLWRRATVGVAVVSNEARFANQVLSQVVNHVENDWRAVLDDYSLELLTVGTLVMPATTEANDTEMDAWFLTEQKES